MVMPLALLEKSLNKKISLLLKDNRVLEGKLTGYDEYMNMVLEETEERTAEQTRQPGRRHPTRQQRCEHLPALKPLNLLLAQRHCSIYGGS